MLTKSLSGAQHGKEGGLFGEMFKADERPAFVGGNIGNPLINYVNGGTHADGDRWVVEICGDELSAPVRQYASVLRAGVALALAH